MFRSLHSYDGYFVSIGRKATADSLHTLIVANFICYRKDYGRHKTNIGPEIYSRFLVDNFLDESIILMRYFIAIK